MARGAGELWGDVRRHLLGGCSDAWCGAARLRGDCVEFDPYLDLPREKCGITATEFAKAISAWKTRGRATPRIYALIWDLVEERRQMTDALADELVQTALFGKVVFE